MLFLALAIMLTGETFKDRHALRALDENWNFSPVSAETGYARLKEAKAGKDFDVHMLAGTTALIGGPRLLP